MRGKGLRAECEERLRELDLPDVIDVRGVARLLEARRGRPVRLWPVRDLPGGTGLWIDAPAADYLCYERHTTALHQELIIAHELGHLIWGHEPAPLAESDLIQIFSADLRPDLVRRALCRTTFSTTQERQAECLATLLLERAVRPAPVREAADDPTTAELLRHLRASFAGHRD